MIAAAIYSSMHEQFHPNLDIKDGTFGYSFILAWIAFAFTLINSIMYLVLRKRTSVRADIQNTVSNVRRQLVNSSRFDPGTL